MVGTTNVVSFMHNDSQTTTLPVQPDTLLQTYLCVQVCICVCVCGPYTLMQAYQTVKNTNDDWGEGEGVSDFVTSVVSSLKSFLVDVLSNVLLWKHEGWGAENSCLCLPSTRVKISALLPPTAANLRVSLQP